MPRILHVLSSLQLGGAERFTLDLARLQREQGVEAAILSLGAHSDTLVKEAESLDIPLYISSAPEGRLQRYRYALSLMKAVEVIHLHSPYALQFLAPLMFLLPYKRYVYTRHGLYPLKEISWKVLHRVMRLFIGVVTFVTRAGLEVFQKQNPGMQGKLVVVENGVYVPAEAATRRSGPLRFGSVGRMVELKGQRFLLESVAKLAAELGDEGGLTFELHFFGSGPLEAELKEQAQGVGPSCKVVFHGVELDREKIYGEIDVLIVSSSSEGLSMVIMEAMAREVCVIATAVGGNTTLVMDQHNGLIVPYGDRAALAAAIRELIEHPQRVAEFGSNAREHVAGEFSLMRTHRAYLELYLPQAGRG